MSPGDNGLIIALIIQFGGLVWGASKIAASVQALADSVQKLDKTVAHLDARVQSHETRVSVLERLQSIVGERP